jgi:drug/metabolite transporter (DMT)-like permease
MSGYQVAPPRWKLWAAFGALYVLWGSNFLAIRYAAEAMPPFLMMAARCLIAGAILLAWAWLRDGERPVPAHWRSAAAVGTLLFLGCHGLLAWAEQTIPSGVAALVMATTPVWLTLLDWGAGGSRPTARALLGLLLGLLGLVVLVGPVPGRGTPLALVVLVSSAFAWAAGSILSRRVSLPSSLVLASGLQLLAGGVALSIVGLLLGEWARVDRGVLAPRAVGGFAYMVVVSSLVGFTAYMWLLRVAPPAQVGTFAFVNPVVALLVGWAIGGETVSPSTLGASAVIVAGVALIVTGAAKDPRGGAYDRARVEGNDAGRTGRRLSRVPQADRRPPLPAHARQSGSEHSA